jgi:hypothetical protein
MSIQQPGQGGDDVVLFHLGDQVILDDILLHPFVPERMTRGRYDH